MMFLLYIGDRHSDAEFKAFKSEETALKAANKELEYYQQHYDCEVSEYSLVYATTLIWGRYSDGWEIEVHKLEVLE